MERNILEEIEKEIDKWGISEKDKAKMHKNIMELRNQNLNILITGATGSGKSSTINAMFNMEVAKVGYGVDPETMDIEKYDLDKLTIWDSPGLGDGKEADVRHAKNIVEKLYEKDKDGNALIDLVLVIVDGSSRDMGTSFELINEVIIPNIENKSRILIGINQCDVAMKGKYWNNEDKKPEIELQKFLDEKAESVRRRVKESTGVDIEPVVYSAEKYYNISKLFFNIVKYTPSKKRFINAINQNKETEIWKKSDELRKYEKETKETIKKSFMESITDGIEKGKDIGGNIGSIIGCRKAGEVIGGVIGGVIGAAGAIWDSIFG